MSGYLSASELAELIGCNPNQRSIMARWLDANGWKWERGRNGLPRVARAYHDKRMGISDGKAAFAQGGRLKNEPNLDAFACVGKNRARPRLQTGR